MKGLHKNKQKMWYSLYEERTPIYETGTDGKPLIDEVTGKKIETGEYVSGYSEPVQFSANISAGKGNADIDVFGADVSYDRTICTTDLTLPITETSIIWKETEPQYDSAGNVDANSADYAVAAKPAISLNSMLIAIRKNKRTGDGGVSNG